MQTSAPAGGSTLKAKKQRAAAYEPGGRASDSVTSACSAHNALRQREFFQRAGGITTHGGFVVRGCFCTYAIDERGGESIVYFSSERLHRRHRQRSDPTADAVRRGRDRALGDLAIDLASFTKPDQVQFFVP